MFRLFAESPRGRSNWPTYKCGPATTARSGVAMTICAWLVLLSVGCGGDGDGVTRYNISGNVTFDGAPVPHGFIQFLPDSAGGNSGPAGSATITDGKFDTATSGQGTIGGSHTVIISGFDGNARPEDELPFGMPLFSEFKTEGDFPKSAHEVDFQVTK